MADLSHNCSGNVACQLCQAVAEIDRLRKNIHNADNNKPFPILAEYSNGRWGRCERSAIPWWLAEVAYTEYVRRFGTWQSLERLAERGGFGRVELIDLLRIHDGSMADTRNLPDRPE